MNTEKRPDRPVHDMKQGVGLFTPALLNPDQEQLFHYLNKKVNVFETLRGSKEGERIRDLHFWSVEKHGWKAPIKLSLLDRVARTKDGEKTQYINQLGSFSYAASEDDLPEWFREMEYREALTGEEGIISFIKAWQNVDYKNKDNNLLLDTEALFEGELQELHDMLNSESRVVAMAYLREDKYQDFYNRFLPEYIYSEFSPNFTSHSKTYNDWYKGLSYFKHGYTLQTLR